MYVSLSHFLKSFSSDQPLLWALLVLATVATASLMLYGFWEIVLRPIRAARSPRNPSAGNRE